jgi:hypothetical protein
LGLNAPKDRRTAPLVFIRVRLLAHDVFIAPFTVAQQREEIALGSAAGEKRRFHPGEVRGKGLKSVDSGVFSVNIVSHLRLGHGSTHCRCGFGYRIAPKIDDFS